MDSSICRVNKAYDKGNHFYIDYFTVASSSRYYTKNYYSCDTTPPQNLGYPVIYAQFYSNDSLFFEEENIPRPAPYSPWSGKFYGKRISGKVPVGIKQFMENQIHVTIYPNPASSIVSISLDRGILKSVALFDGLGNTLIFGEANEINITSLSDGIYYLEIQTSFNVETKKIAVLH